MTPAPVARYLREFGPDGQSDRLRNGIDAGSEAARLETAYARGVAEGQTRAIAELDAKFEQQRAVMEQRHADARRAWVSAEAEKLAARLQAGLHEAETAIAGVAARILKPFLASAVHRQAVGELLETVRSLLSASDGGVRLHLSGPTDLLDAMRGKLEGAAAAVTFEPSEDCEVRVVADGTVLETRIGAWLARIEEARG